MTSKEYLFSLRKNEGLLNRRAIKENEIEEYEKKGYEIFEVNSYQDNASTSYYILDGDSELTTNEYIEMLLLRQIEILKVIKNCIIFFTILIVIWLMILLISFII